MTAAVIGSTLVGAALPFSEADAEMFMRPYNRKVWARDPETMTSQWIGDRVAVVDLRRIRENVRLQRDEVSWGPNNRFRFPAHGGTGAIWRALADELSSRHRGRVQFQRRLAHLDTVRRRATFDDGMVVRYGRLLSTIPLDELVRLSDLAVQLDGEVARLEYSSTHIVGVGLDIFYCDVRVGSRARFDLHHADGSGGAVDALIEARLLECLRRQHQILEVVLLAISLKESDQRAELFHLLFGR